MIMSADRTVKVLIVPLWNWNAGNAYQTEVYSAVLIVPLWNWNMLAIQDLGNEPRFNRTFMELKSEIEHGHEEKPTPF